MDLYFLRHGRAAQRGEWTDGDADRPLTDQGREEMARVSGFLAKLGLALDAIVTSPYARARQTAEIVALHLNLQDRLVVDEKLAPGFSPQRLGSLLKSYPGAKALMLVGHEPDFSATVGRLVGGRIDLKKGGIAYVKSTEAPPKEASLVWLVQPSILGL